MRQPKNPPSTFGGHLYSGDILLGVLEWRNTKRTPWKLYYIWTSADGKMVVWENDMGGDQRRTYIKDLKREGRNKAFLTPLLEFLEDYDDPSVSPNARSRKARA